MRNTPSHLQVPREKTPRRPANPRTLRSTDVKRRFGRVLDEVSKGRDIIITRRGARLAVLVSLDRYNGLVSVLRNAGPGREQFERRYALMQTPKVQAGTARGVAASPAKMGRAAAAAARRDRDGK